MPVDLKLEASRISILEKKQKGRESVDLEKAKVLVCVGRGLRQKEDLHLIQSLADAVGGEIGASKSLVTDFGWLSEDRLVGLSGKKCKPKLAFSIGISGQSQHIVGINNAQVVVAINNDQNAPIFKTADYGIIGDLYQVVPLITRKIMKS